MAPLGVRADTIQTVENAPFGFIAKTFLRQISPPRQFAFDAITAEQPPPFSLFVVARRARETRAK